MSHFVHFVITSAAILILAGCTDKDEQVTGSPEEVLPGLWRIESVELTDYDEGITFQGSTFYNDTVLLNIGTIQISSFSLDTLEARDLEQHKVESVLEISGGQMDISINSLFMSGTEWRTAIRYNGPSGYHAVDTPVEEFYFYTHGFNNMYTLILHDNDHVELFTSNENENHVIHLVRN